MEIKDEAGFGQKLDRTEKTGQRFPGRLRRCVLGLASGGSHDEKIILTLVMGLSD